MAKRDAERINAPGRGNRTPPEVEAIFASEYLRTGIVSVSAKKAKIPQPTGYELANRLEEDPEFVKNRKALLTRGLDRVEAMLIRSCETAAKRVQKKIRVTPFGESDNGHHYLRALSDAHRSLTARCKIDHDIAPENKPQWPAGLRITIDGQPETEPTPEEPCKS